MNFTISYEDAKKVLGVFYNSPYQNVLQYVAILDNLKCVDSDVTLKQAVEAEHAANVVTQNAE
jgi:hypothetical protein